jgi:hypothetical protein
MAFWPISTRRPYEFSAKIPGKQKKSWKPRSSGRGFVTRADSSTTYRCLKTACGFTER